jgi:hypothetical protein
MAEREKVYIFWDNSNIFIPAQEVANRKDGAGTGREVRIQFDHLFDLAKAGREVVQGVCVGSVPPELEHVWKRLRATGVVVELYERGKGSGKEQGVDQCLQVHMLRAIADAPAPATAVLMTGDGAGYYDGAGFHADLERMAKRGWGIEVLSWDIACNRRLREWAKAAGVYIALEDFYNSITFRENVRRSTQVSLMHRGRAKPRL